MPEPQDKQTYAEAGVDIDAADRALDLIKKHTRSTLRPEVLSDLGFFGGLFELKGYNNPVLVSSADGVGTKLKIAAELGIYDTIGIDLVNHCINDILTCGAEPLYFLDYVGVGKLFPEHVGDIVKGLSQACKDANCALIGGETAEMPGVYAEGDFDLVGFIVGIVEKDKIIDGKSIQSGDVILGLPSSGIHTNGYSLVRKLFDITPSSLHALYPELRCTLGEELLRPHRCYFNQIKPILPKVKGLAHITGGGLLDNIPRIFKTDVSAQLSKGSWYVPPIFGIIQKLGNIDEQEMYRVFNMGVGMAIFCSPSDAEELMASMPDAKRIGVVVEGNRTVIIS
ncbi:MAG: phosphoribosylformylglycinamidine cyclo-ligase [Chloroflexi bacterium]|jgi:phosphoribosylformylglycinamidine cyclo-ligase|nr:phosphoribosylformylglycinamidine cyclo-ligase [Chloroflexota bacterium]